MTAVLDRPAARPAAVPRGPARESDVPPELAEGAGLYRLTVERYHDLIAAGAFADGPSIELLEGILVEKMPESALHTFVIYALLRWLWDHLPADVTARGPAPVTTPDSEPEPDLCVARGPATGYADRHPRPDETLLLVEVANTSLSRDRGWKQRIYARAGTPLYLIIDLQNRRVEVYRDPTGPVADGGEPGYRDRAIFAEHDPVALPVAGLPPLILADLLPPAAPAA